MGSGKSTLGLSLAKLWHCEFIDLDQYIESKVQSSLETIFERQGESVFREMEQEALTELLDKPSKCIIALGGGTPCFGDNMKAIKASARSVYLKLSSRELSRRLSISTNPRPLIRGKSITELQEYITQEIVKREKYYNQADLIIESDSIRTNDLITFLSAS